MLMFLSNISLELHYTHSRLEFNAKRTGYGSISIWYGCLSSTEKLLCTESEKFFKMKAAITELTSHSVIWFIATLQSFHENLASNN